MPHYVKYRPKAYAKDGETHSLDLLLGFGYITGSLAYTIGSWMLSIWLGADVLLHEKRMSVAELLFIYGGCIFVVLPLIGCIETCMAKASLSEWVENFLYFIGGAMFLAAACLQMSKSDEFVSWGAMNYMFGSLSFAVASFVNALELNSHGERGTTNIPIISCANYEVGGLLFIAGSVASLDPITKSCSMWLFEFGYLCYFLGSCAYIVGDILNFSLLVRIRFCSQKVKAQDDEHYEYELQECMFCTKSEDSFESTMTSDQKDEVLSDLSSPK